MYVLSVFSYKNWMLNSEHSVVSCVSDNMMDVVQYKKSTFGTSRSIADSIFLAKWLNSIKLKAHKNPHLRVKSMIFLEHLNECSKNQNQNQICEVGQNPIYQLRKWTICSLFLSPSLSQLPHPLPTLERGWPIPPLAAPCHYRDGPSQAALAPCSATIDRSRPSHANLGRLGHVGPSARPRIARLHWPHLSSPIFMQRRWGIMYGTKMSIRQRRKKCSSNEMLLDRN